MPVMKNVYDRETGETLVRDALTAKECCDNDPGRYRLTPWPKLSARDAKAADKAAARRPSKAAKESTAEPADGDESPPASEAAAEES